ncbi:MAG: hypothetical protein ACE5OQ_07655 [Woeseia sp.]
MCATPTAIGRNDTDSKQILVLDRHPKSLGHILSASGIWPHKVISVASVSDAIRWCRLFTPTAVIAPLDLPGTDDAATISTLRAGLASVPIIALGAASDHPKLSAVLDQGADAFLSREDLEQPNLLGLVMRIKQRPRTDKVGALVCDVNGAISVANERLADWLRYPSSQSLIGKCVQRDLMQCPDDWRAWASIIAGLAVSLHQLINVKTQNGRVLRMQVEIFTLPGSSNGLQAILVDKTRFPVSGGRRENA